MVDPVALEEMELKAMSQSTAGQLKRLVEMAEKVATVMKTAVVEAKPVLVLPVS